MSISALADDEILRTNRRTLDMTRVIDPHLVPIIATLGLDAPKTAQLQAALRPIAAESPVQKTPSSNALDGLVKYIPTESITLYVAATATAAMSSFSVTFPSLTPLRLYLCFVVLTPILFLLIYVGKRRSLKLPPLPESVAEWPWWKLVASTIAFAVWALAVPPLVASDAGKVVAAFGALFVSTILSLVGAVVEPPES
ncbi:MAG: hypothetical protein QOJ96_502 [Alphaproteobacteria bacterium]|jgi:hypothetical protein|nr:hypothetical protein [Alphaproteobacteria bacterium]